MTKCTANNDVKRREEN